MTSCEGCKYVKSRRYAYQCLQCCGKYTRLNWEPNSEIAGLIEAAEQKAFADGRELHPTNFAERKYQTFDQWKEESNESMSTCKHFEQPIYKEPYISCINESNWQPDDLIVELIKAAERKAFESGWERAIDLYEAGELRGYTKKDFEGYKEAAK